MYGKEHRELSLADGATIGQYTIVSSLGAGGVGEVFRAQDGRLDREVALKVLPMEFADDDERMTRFVREARSASALNHPSILTIYEIGEASGYHYLATELVVGRTLRDDPRFDELVRRVDRAKLDLAASSDRLSSSESAGSWSAGLPRRPEAPIAFGGEDAKGRRDRARVRAGW